jgi:nucleotide-binding universal stress UspA family protein
VALAAVDALERARLPLVERPAHAEQLRVEGDAAERRAQLVAHEGEQVVLGARRRGRLGARLLGAAAAP